MKSFEKFQYDTSPYEIDEEVEELDEDLVGMVKKGITATGNVLDKAKKPLENIGTAVGNRVGAVKSSVSQSLQKAGAVPKPADRLPSTRRYQPGQQRTGSPDRTELAKKQTRSTIASNSTKEDPKITPAGTKSPMQKLKDAGGIRSKGVRNAASVANAIRKGLTAKPDQRISYDAKGSGFGGPTMGVGKNIQQAATNVGDAPLFKKTKVDPVTGRVTKGKVRQTVKDRLGITNLVNKGETKKENDNRRRTIDKSAKEFFAQQSVGKEITGDNIDKASKVPSEQEKTKELNKRIKQDKQSKEIKKQIEDETGQKTGKFTPKKVTKSRTDVGGDATKNIVKKSFGKDAIPDDGGKQGQKNLEKELGLDKQEKKKKKKMKTTNEFEKTRSRIDIEPQMDPKTGKMLPPKPIKKTKDGYPAGKDATHWLDAQKQHSSKTPKLFEQFLFEIETRSTKKKKDGRGMHPHNEIKPMSGTNTITINPEDETSKYKRGY